MDHRLGSYRGCLMGLAAGDAVGFGLEKENGFLPTTAYTQLAAYCCNGLLLGMTRGQLTGTMAPPVSYIRMALTEWAALQSWRAPSRGPLRCWISHSDRLDYRRCPEPELPDLLCTDKMGTMEEPVGNLSGPGALMAAAAVGLFFDPGRLRRREIHRLGAEAAALTHGRPEAFLSGTALAHMVSRMVWDGDRDLKKLAKQSAFVIGRRFRREYPQAVSVVGELLRRASEGKEIPKDRGAAFALAEAIRCCLAGGDFETVVGRAAAHSHGAAAVAGAILGAMGTQTAVPEELAEQLECGEVLLELAEDMFRGCPMMLGSRVFDIEWDEKYAAGGL